jgi:hypothetical protein
VTEYTGSRRVGPSPSPALPVTPFVEDDAAMSCPECGATVRPGQEWCTLCLHVLRAPEAEPEPEPEPLPVPEPASLPASVPVLEPERVPLPAQAAPAAAEALPVDAPAPAPAAPELAPEVEAAAAALLEQLAVESQREGGLPSFLSTKTRVAMSVMVVMSGLSVVVMLALTVLGALTR